MENIAARIIKNAPLVGVPTQALLRPLVKDSLESLGLVNTRDTSGVWGALRNLAATGQLISLEGREGLHGITDTLANITPLELVSLGHPSPSKRLIANRLARKLDLNVTEICNYDCSYCYQRSRDDDWEHKATKAETRELSFAMLLDVAREADALGTRRVKITGGEPLTKRGIFKFINLLLTELSFEQIELCTNGSLIQKNRQALAEAIAGNEHRFHIHTSVDGIAPKSSDKSLTKASPEHLLMLQDLLSHDLSGVSVSVNTMWNPDLLVGNQLDELYDFMIATKVERWTLSFPYFVRDFIEACAEGQYDNISYASVVKASGALIERHIREGMPFTLSIPLIFKQELFAQDSYISRAQAKSHPCFPCHGSFFVVGPEGDLFDCLLCDYSQSNVKSHDTLLEAALAQTNNNPFYELTTAEVGKECAGCRYEVLCHGQCPNDRANTNIGSAAGKFGRDKTACSLLRLAEEEIWKKLPSPFSQKLLNQIDPEGFFPADYASPAAIVKSAPPIRPDALRDGHSLKFPSIPSAAAAVFHKRSVSVIPVVMIN